ncbi:MAG: tetratricopeptide repeat protein [Bacteroidales bacterium]|nr:tetratricopeptide repeat protein [Bacteroidales bacterium]
MNIMSTLKKILFTCLIFIASVVNSQNILELEEINKPDERIEFLRNIAKPYLKTNPDSARFFYNMALQEARQASLEKLEATVLRNIGNSYYKQGNFDSCVFFVEKSINISVKIDDYQGLISAYNRKAVVHWLTNDFVSSIGSFDTTARYAEMVYDSARTCNCYLMIGACHYNNGAYPKALESYQKALQIAEKSDNKAAQARALNNIASIQDELKNYSLALSYYQQAIDLKIQMGDEKGAMATKENMATVYSKKGDYDHALEQYRSALNFKEKADDQAGISVSLMNIGFAFEKLGKFNNALDYYSRSLKILYKLDDHINIAICLNNIGDIYYAQGKYQQAIDSSQKSLAIGEKLDSKTRVKSSALSLTKSYVERDNYKQAYNYHVLYSVMKDSLFNEKSAKVLQEMETKYQTEKKQQEIEKQDLEIEKKDAEAKTRNILLYAAIGGLLLVVLIAVQVFRGYKQKKKANALLSSKNVEIEEKNIHLNEANTEISSKKAEIEEKNLNIMDSIRYAKRIQQTILPREEFVETHLPKSFILYKPKDIVSGDFYWVEKIGSKIYASAVDCTGHGVPGAFVSIVGYNSLNRTVMEFKLEKPSDILIKLNDLVVDTFVRHSDSDVKDGMDMSLLSIDLDTNDIEFAGAQNPLYIVNEGGLEEIKGNKQPIGSSLEVKVFDNHEVKTQKGDMVYLFTDGYIDQFGGPKGKKFMRKKFKELLQSIHKLDVKTQKLHLDNTIKDWMKDEEQLDDILVIGIRV